MAAFSSSSSLKLSSCMLCRPVEKEEEEVVEEVGGLSTVRLRALGVFHCPFMMLTRRRGSKPSSNGSLPSRRANRTQPRAQMSTDWSVMVLGERICSGEVYCSDPMVDSNELMLRVDRLAGMA